MTTDILESRRTRNCGGVLESDDQRDDWSDGLSTRMFLQKDESHVQNPSFLPENTFNLGEGKTDPDQKFWSKNFSNSDQ